MGASPRPPSGEDTTRRRRADTDDRTSIFAGLVGGEALLDLCYVEDSQADTDMNAVMTADGGIIELQATAERAPFSREQSQALLDLTAAGIHELVTAQRQAVAA